MASSPSPPPALPSYPFGLASAAAATVGVAFPAATPGHGPWDGVDASPDSSPNDFGSAASSSGWPVALGPVLGHAPSSREEKQGSSYPLGVFEHAQTYYMQQLLLQQHQQLLQRQALAQQQQQQQQQRSHRPESRPPSSSGNVPSDSPRSRPGPDFAAPDFSASPEAHFHFSRRTAPKSLLQPQGHAASKPRSTKRSSLPAPLNSPADAWRDHAARPGSSNHSAVQAHPHGHRIGRPEAQLQHARRSVQGGSRRQRQRSADWATSSPRALHAPYGSVTDFDPEHDPFPPRERGGASFQSDSNSDSESSDGSDEGSDFGEQGHLALLEHSPTSATSASDESSRWSRADELFIDDLAASFLNAPLPFARGTGGFEQREDVHGQQRRERLRNGSGNYSGGARESVRMPSQSPPRPCSSSSSAQPQQQPQQSDTSFARRSADLSARVASLLRQEGGAGGNVLAEPGGTAKQRPRSTTGTRPAAVAGSAGTRAHGNGNGNGNGWAHSRDTSVAGTVVSRAGSAPRMRASHAHSHSHGQGAAQPRTHQSQAQQARQQRPHSSSVLSPRSGAFSSWSPSPSPFSASSWHSSAGASSSAAAAAEAAAIFASSETLSPRPATTARCRSAGFAASPTAATAASRSAGVSVHTHPESLDSTSATATATAPPCTLAASLGAHGSPFYAQLPPELWGLILGFLDSSAVLCRLGRVDRTGARVAREPDAWVSVSFAGFGAAMAAAGPSSSGGSGGSDAALTLRASLLSTTTTTRLLGLVASWSCLRDLDLSGLCSLVDDTFLSRVVEAAGERVRAHWSRGMERLSLARCGAVTDAGLRALAPCCGALRALDLSWVGLVTPVGLAAVLERCGPALERLVLNRCHALGDGGLRELARGAPRLRELDLTFCGGVTDAGVAALTSPESVCFRPRAADDEVEGQGEGGQAHPGLQRLCLRWCRQITDESVRLLCAPHRYPPIAATDDAPEADGIDRANVASPSALPGGDDQGGKMRSCALVSLNLDHCSLLTDSSLLHLSKWAPSLRTLSAVHCPRLTPASMAYLADGVTTQLRSVILDHCDQFRAYFAVANRAVLRSLLLPAGPAAADSAPAPAAGGRVRIHPLAQLRLLSWRTCGHAGLERSRHAEIEAECCNGLAGPAASGGAGGDDEGDGGTAAGSDGNNVLDWIRAAPSASSSTPRSSPPPSARSRLGAARSFGARL